MNQMLILNAISGVIATISFICTIFNLILIWSMNIWNSFLAILWYMAIYQLIYDGFYYLNLNTDMSIGYAITWHFFELFSALGVTFWSNVLSGMMLVVVIGRFRFDALAHMLSLNLVVFVPSFVVAFIDLMYAAPAVNDDINANNVLAVYFWLRIISIAVNMVIMIIVLVQIENFRRSHKRTFQGKAPLSPAEASIVVLSRRMILYPLMQLITRLPAAVYEELYGFSISNHAPLGEFICKVFYYGTSSASGLGFLIIFLIFQPNAWEHFLYLLQNGKFKPEVANPIAAAVENIMHTAQDAMHSTSTDEFAETYVTEQQQRLMLSRMATVDEDTLLNIIWEKGESSTAVSRKNTEGHRSSLNVRQLRGYSS